MKYIGVDYGSKRVGIAVSDEGGTFAFPKSIVPQKEALQYVLSLCKESETVAIVIGKSIDKHGTVNKIMTAIEEFGKELKSQTDVPIHFEREDFSSFEAHRFQTDKGSRDDSAAAIILQRFLDRKNMRD